MSTINQPLVSTIDRPTACIAEATDLGLSHDLYEGLTEREGLIALLVARGCEDWQIARQLNSDPPAIQQEIRQVLEQLNVRSTTDLAETVRLIEM